MEKKRSFLKPPKQTDVSTSRLESTTSRFNQYEQYGQTSVYNEDVRRLVESRLVQNNSSVEPYTKLPTKPFESKA